MPDPIDDVLKQEIAKQWLQIESQREQIDAQQEQITAQQKQLTTNNDLSQLLAETIDNFAGVNVREDLLSKHLERIEKNLGGLVTNRLDLDDGQRQKVAGVLAPMQGADLRSVMRVEPWTYVPATDPAAIAKAAELLAERAALIDAVKDQAGRLAFVRK